MRNVHLVAHMPDGTQRVCAKFKTVEDCREHISNSMILSDARVGKYVDIDGTSREMGIYYTIEQKHTSMYDLREKIAKTRRTKKLTKILEQACDKYGFLSTQYNEILDLCLKKAEEINGGRK